jgi:hypothetical protein
MALTTEQLRIAAEIDAAMQKLARAGQDDVTIFAGMAGHMADFKRLMDAAGQDDMNELGAAIRRVPPLRQNPRDDRRRYPVRRP